MWSGSLGQPVAHVGDKSNSSAVCVAFHPDGQQVLAGFYSGHVRLYDITSGMVISSGYTHVFVSNCTLFDSVCIFCLYSFIVVCG